MFIGVVLVIVGVVLLLERLEVIEGGLRDLLAACYW